MPDDVYKSWIRAKTKLDFPHDSVPVVNHLRGLGVQSNATLRHHIRGAYGHTFSAKSAVSYNSRGSHWGMAGSSVVMINTQTNEMPRLATVFLP